MNEIYLQDCTLADLHEAISIALRLQKLTTSDTIEVYVKGNFVDRQGEIVFSQYWYHKVLDATHLHRRSKYFSIVVDNEQINVTPIDTMEIKINV